MRKSSNKIQWFILILLTLILGFIAGSYFTNHSAIRSYFVSPGNKVDVILKIIGQQYVDTVSTVELIEDAIPKIISELDPHSSYIPAKDLEAVNEDIEGHFSGIGVQFNRQEDTIMVVSVISGGPSEKVGLQSGDRIVTINDSIVAGVGITDEKVVKSLRGTKGTKVKVGIKRNDSEEIQVYEITRGDVPVNTIDVYYEVEEGIGLIKLNKFGKTSYSEFIHALGILSQSGCHSYILDLRQNTGGLLDVAINICNEFLSKGQLIVYTEGKAFPRSDAYANGTGSCQRQQLIVLIDEMSASASEIVAGAIQDNDRGLVVGRRSFGKGLVQNQIQLSDGSALRLTIARYHTPSGRCIQKEYEMGKGTDYEQDLINRFNKGEFDSQDSIKQVGNIFRTLSGRPVYGGGGIMADVFVPRDTVGITSYYSQLIQNGILYQYAFQYSDKNRERLKQFNDYQSLWKHLKGQPLLEEVVRFAETKNIRRRPVLVHKSARLIENMAQAYIIRNIFGDSGFYPVYLNDDPIVAKAVEIIKKGEAFPQKP